MSASFRDPSKAEECFVKLNQMKDNSIFSALLELLDEATTINAQNTRVRFTQMFPSDFLIYFFYLAYI